MTKYEDLYSHLLDNQYVWLITGVAGFIGSNLLEKLLILNQSVVGLDNFETGYQHNIDEAISDAAAHMNISPIKLKSNFKFIKGDICKLSDCEESCEGVNFVLHQAALGSVPRSIKDPVSTNETNINGFLNILLASRDAKVDRLVYAASSSTYGDHPGLPKVEEIIGNPLSPYAVTKLVNELYANVFSNTYGLESVGLRYFNVFGKRQDPKGAYAAVIPKWIGNIINGEDVFINGDGETSRDFCYIENTIQMNLLAAMSKNKASVNQVYNVAIGERTSLNKLYEMIQTNLLASNQDLVVGLAKYQDYRVGDVRHSMADISKAKKLFGYEPSHNLRNGLDEAMTWYLNSLK